MNDESAYEDEMYQNRQEIWEEYQEYAENVQRSEDDGWFYPDEDPE